MSANLAPSEELLNLVNSWIDRGYGYPVVIGAIEYARLSVDTMATMEVMQALRKEPKP